MQDINKNAAFLAALENEKLSINQYLTAKDIDSLAAFLAALILQPPIIFPHVSLNDCRLKRYLDSHSQRYGTLHTAIQYIDRYVNQLALEGFETNETIREFLIYLHEQKGINRVPYLHRILPNLANDLNIPIKTLSNIEEIVNKSWPILHKWKNEKGLKFYSGQINTIIGMYDHTLTDETIKPDLEATKKCQHHIDLGGGYATAYISKLYATPFTSYDLIDPKTILKIGPYGFTGQNLFSREEVANVPWQPFNVLHDEFPSNFDSYSIFSFGFINSTVGNPDISIEKLKFFSWKRILNLVLQGKYVYCYFYGRPSAFRIRYPVIQFWFENQQLIKIKALDDKFSRIWDKPPYNFGKE